MNPMLVNEKTTYRYALVLYMFSYGLTFFYLNTFFWDDWINYFDINSLDTRWKTGAFSGFSPVRLVLEWWMAESFLSSFRIFSFLAFLIAALSLNGILKAQKWLTVVERHAIVILFLLLPANSARASMTIFMYTFSYCVFFLAWWIYATQRNLFALAVSLFLFLFSFDTASLLVFMIVPLSLSLYNFLESGQHFGNWLKRNLIFCIAPIAFWFIEPKLNPMVDITREVYYTPKLSGMLRGALLLGLSIIFIGWGLIQRKWKYEHSRGQIQFAIGFLLTALAMFPYFALGHFANLNTILIGFIPGSSDWDSRHQLLMPLGLAVMIVGLVNFVTSTNIHKFSRTIALVALVSSFFNFSTSQEYLLDARKQRDIIEALSSNNDVKKFHSVLIDDQALRFNARGRSIRSFEWDKILQMANPGLNQTSDVFRYVDCSSPRPEAIIRINATNGRLRALVFNDVGVTIEVLPIEACVN